jgi:hypothetical protein
MMSQAVAAVTDAEDLFQTIDFIEIGAQIATLCSRRNSQFIANSIRPILR